jgi:hypothetical protein
MFAGLKTLFKSMLSYGYTVEQIHEEIDTAQDRLIQSADSLLKELRIPTESEVERKAKLLKEIGFHNSETVAKAKSLEEERIRQNTYVNKKKQEAELLRYYKQEYPFQKFLTMEEFDRICDKYGLIYSNIGNYIKDVPEKNLLDIKNTSRLKQLDYPEPLTMFQVDAVKAEIMGLTEKEISEVKKGIILTGDQSIYMSHGYYDSNSNILTAYYKKEITSNSWRSNDYRDVSKIQRTGYMIAAPKSHFDLSDKKQVSEKGFFDYQRVNEPLDPIVFEYCRGEMVRIATKWGTADDQSYLDPKLVNETLN